MIQTAPDTTAIIGSRPKSVVIADLFTFVTISGSTYSYTNAPRAITLGGVTYKAGPTKLSRGQISLSRGLSVDSHQVEVVEQDGAILESIELGYFNLATYTLARTFAASPTSPYTTPVVRFVGQVAQVDEIGYSKAKITVKSMLNLLDRDFPTVLMQASCPNVLYGAACGLSRASYIVSGAVGSGSTQNTLQTGLAQAAGYFSLGILSFTSGVLAGISYMVKTHAAGGVIYPAYPFLQAPAVGDTFNISPGCDKTLATCESKFGYVATAGTAPFFRGLPFIPDPVVAY